jgi:hypothetical protein
MAAKEGETMQIQSGKTLAISLFLTIVPDTNAQASMPQITVGFINTAEIDRKALKQGLEFAAMILRSTGVELLTVDCSLDASRAAPPCSGFTGPNQISIRLIRRFQKETGEIGFRKLGFADELDTTSGSGIVYLFCEMIEAAARDRRVPLQDVLGVVITHEIGHLLIAAGHSQTGIMRSQLGEGEWRKASQGMLGFTPRQAEIIRQGILGRQPAREQKKVKLIAVEPCAR